MARIYYQKDGNLTEVKEIAVKTVKATNHADLAGRSKANQHPMSAITGLAPNDASVGDLLRVKTVDALGVPTELESVPFEEMEGVPVLVKKVTLAKAEKFKFDKEDDGTPVKYRSVFIRMKVPQSADGSWLSGLRVSMRASPGYPWSDLISEEAGNVTNSGAFVTMNVYTLCGMWHVQTSRATSEWAPLKVSTMPYSQLNTITVATNNSIGAILTTGIMPAGTEIEIKAVKA